MTTKSEARLVTSMGFLTLIGSTEGFIDFSLDLTKFPALEGKRLGVVFYDARIFASSKDLWWGGERGNLDHFAKPGATIIPDTQLTDDDGSALGSARNPLVHHGSGVLLVLEGTLRKQRLANGKRQAWAFLPDKGKTQENPQPGLGRAEVRGNDENGVDGVLGHAVWRDDDLKWKGGSTWLLVRVIVLEAAAGFQVGQVFASSLCPDHVLTDGQGKPVRLNINRQPDPTPTTLGSAAPAPVPTVHATGQRVLSPDLTGFWEVGFDQKDCPLTLYMHQAGHMLVGWFQPPATRLTFSHPATLPQGFPNRAGTFTCVREGTGPWKMKWGFSTGDAFDNECDPGDVGRETSNGTIELVSKTLPKDAIQQLSFMLQITADQSVTFVATRRGGLWARWPRYLIETLAKESPAANVTPAVRDLATLASRPIPTSYYDHVNWLLSANNPAMRSALETFHNAQSGIENKADEIKASSEVANILKAAAQSLRSDELRLVTPVIRLFLWQNTIILSGTQDSKSILDCINQIVEFEIRLASPDPSKIDKIFTTLGLAGPPRFAYELNFVSLPTGDMKVGLGGGVAAFKVTITKSSIDPKDPNKLTPVTTNGWKDSASEWFDGAFGNIGAGIGFSGKTPKSKGGDGIFPDKMVFRAFQDLDLHSFEGVSFTVCGVKAGKIGWAAFKYTGFSSSYISLTTHDGAVLDTVVDKNNDGPTNVGLDAVVDFIKDPVKGAAKYGLNGMPSFEVTAATVSMGWGYFGTPKSYMKTITPLDDDRAAPQLIGEPKFRLQTSFDLDSAVLATAKILDMEKALAVHRIMFTEGDADVKIDGYASPEDTEDHNQILSDTRATATANSIVDAFGTTLTVKNVGHKGHGEMPSRLIGGLINPETATKAEKPKVEEQTKNDYAMWRRTDLWTAGKLVIRLRPD